MVRHNRDFTLFDAEPSPFALPVSSEGQRGHKQVPRMAHRDPDAVAASITYGRAYHKSSHAVSKASNNREVSDEVRHRSSHKDRHHVSVPPKAPKIPRLPTPDFDDMDYGRYDVSNHQFCACCGNNGGSGEECTKAKMERRGMSPHSITDLVVGFVRKYLI
ncbi:hypothetical protein Daesc_009092 [Daldinia eschscholtzii]|uniref:Uncharacterized protein n=1 Tax=Daldinia eschscholtzii TaxID=292717 RepID=A0AAX6M8N9_9PEZI